MKNKIRTALLSGLDYIFGKDATEVTIFSPSFLISRKLAKATKSLSGYAKGDVLDIGSGTAPYRKYFKNNVNSYTTFDKQKPTESRRSTAKLRGDLLKNNLKTSTYDTVIFTQVLECIQDPQKGLSEIHRILKPKGVLFLSAPFIYPVHNITGHDYFRFSEYGLRILLTQSGFKIRKVIRMGTFWTTYACLTNLYLFTGLFTTSKARKIIRVPLFPFLLIFYLVNNLICLLLDKLDNKSYDYSPNFVVLAIKKK